jgi:isoleucyl-tRNA synthetase
MADSDKSEVAKQEEEILKFWKENQIFEKSLVKSAPEGEFVFYDGPPFATGTPHSGSLLSSVSKDVVPRYKTMRGYRVRRRWGWDTHGLPIESLVEKKLGLKNKKEILATGVEKFNETARSMVLEYVNEWKRYVERVGRWVDFDNSYKTMDNAFIESVWWALKEIHTKGNLYEGRKVLMYCPHCETPLAKAEIAMDNTYKDVTEEAVTVKFKVKNPEKHGLPENTFILAWTTTPWTLPGNVALAVGSDIEYRAVKNGGETFIVAKELMSQVEGGTIKELHGGELVGVEYEPLYEIEKVKAHSGKKWHVLPADFVTTEDGTGVVHTAVIYGEDDYNLGLKEGLPMIPILNPNATYNDDAPEFIRGQYIKKAEALIKADLESRGLLFSKAPHTHSYPHCYRCGTPLIYNAVSSWFINIQAVKEKMLAENEKITWFPEHLKHGRFRKNLETAPDWTISRNRFWASPLPFWKDETGNVTVIGSLAELKAHTKKSGNRYFVMRHGETDGTVAHRMSSDPDLYHLTEKGEREVAEAALRLAIKPTMIFASPFARTRESAAIAAEELSFPQENIIFDERIREFNLGELSGKTKKEWLSFRSGLAFDETVPGGESYQGAKNRFGDFLYDLESRYSNEIILIVTHGVGLECLSVIAEGLDKIGSRERIWSTEFGVAEILPLDFTPLPHNADYELDYHLPYIDRINLEREDKPLTRVPEVVDCWVESGAMPFAEYHYPFENKGEFLKRSPGDFVSEYIGQTRAWFYYMHAMSAQLFGRLAFRNVVTTGTILAADGNKLSKSKKNYTDPYELFDRFGADAFRYYIMSSVVMQAEDLTFRDEDVKEAANRVLNILRNTHAFYKLYESELNGSANALESPHVLDRWILEKLEALVATATEAFDRYDVIRATRPLRDFVEDFSTWYLRRSRDRMKGEDERDKQYALSTMRHVFHVFSRVSAPVIPFVAEEIYKTVRDKNDPESVHLAEWPAAHGNTGQTFFSWFSFSKKSEKRNTSELVKDMAEVRRIVSLGLEARQKAGIKVRQPLQKLTVSGGQLAGKTEFLDLIKDEINVKEIAADTSLPAEGVVLDTEITDALKKEGEFRDLVREVQDLRKTAGLQPGDQAVLVFSAEKEGLVMENWTELARMTNLIRKESGTTLNVRLNSSEK